jgi:hypothetical protein
MKIEVIDWTCRSTSRIWSAKRTKGRAGATVEVSSREIRSSALAWNDNSQRLGSWRKVMARGRSKEWDINVGVLERM